MAAKEQRSDFSLAGIGSTASAGGSRIGHRSSAVSRVRRTEDLARWGGGDMEKWRNLFHGANIYDVIHNAILIAATDSPRKLRRHRDIIIQLLFAVAPVLACSPGKAAPPPPPPPAAGGANQLSHPDAGSMLRGASNSKKNGVEATCAAIAEPAGDHKVEDDVNLEEGEFVLPLETSTEASTPIDQDIAKMVEMLADEIEEDAQEINEVLRIKDILMNYKEQSAETLFDCLRRLQLMRLSMEKLKSTEILNAVAPLRNHKSPKICELVSAVTNGWKGVADDWVRTTSTVIGDNKLDFLNSSAAEDDVGLLIPPMDVGALLLTQSTAIGTVSELLHGLDAEGNVIPGIESNCNNQNSGARKKAKKNKQYNEQGLPTVQELPNPSVRKPVSGHVNLGMRARTSQDQRVGIGKKNIYLANLELEGTKRKLHEAYQEAEKEKKKRSVQLLELDDIPKSGPKRTTPTKQRNRASGFWSSRLRR